MTKHDTAMLADLKKGKRGAVARAISIVENDPVRTRTLLKKIFKHSGGSTVIGITGPPGAGKSSLVNKISVEMQKLGTNPAILAIDPTSHITGGAMLGDRVRMTESTDSGTYIRSIASRGSTGAVSRSLRNSIRVLEYAGFNPIIIESVGAGQTEVEISNIVDVTLVVFTPNTGDSIQTIKAGIAEIGDIYIVNKFDLDGALKLFDSIRDHIGGTEKSPPVLKTSAKTGRGIKDLARRLKAAMTAQKTDGRLGHARTDKELRDIVLNNIKEHINMMLDSDKSYARYLEKVRSRDMDPFEAADRISKSALR